MVVILVQIQLGSLSHLVELVDTSDLKSGSVWSAGSSPAVGKQVGFGGRGVMVTSAFCMCLLSVQVRPSPSDSSVVE